MTAYAGLPSVMIYLTLTIAIGQNAYGPIQNDVYFFSSKNPMAMAVMTTKIGIGQRVQVRLEMFWHIGSRAL